MDRLYLDRVNTVRMGVANKSRISELHIDWNTVISSLTS
jgi:hypothetical protein